jgi:hypothetical protein
MASHARNGRKPEQAEDMAGLPHIFVDLFFAEFCRSGNSVGGGEGRASFLKKRSKKLF